MQTAQKLLFQTVLGAYTYYADIISNDIVKADVIQSNHYSCAIS